MPHHWWTRKHLVFTLALVSLACIAAAVVMGLGSPERAHSVALGPQWQCSRLAFVFTVCSRVSEIESAIVRVARQPACRRPRA